MKFHRGKDSGRIFVVETVPPSTTPPYVRRGPPKRLSNGARTGRTSSHPVRQFLIGKPNVGFQVFGLREQKKGRSLCTVESSAASQQQRSRRSHRHRILEQQTLHSSIKATGLPCLLRKATVFSSKHPSVPLVPERTPSALHRQPEQASKQARNASSSPRRIRSSFLAPSRHRWGVGAALVLGT